MALTLISTTLCNTVVEEGCGAALFLTFSIGNLLNLFIGS